MQPDPDQRPYVTLGTRRTVRPTAVRIRRFVEFEFVVDSDGGALDENLAVELVMPWPELVAFAAKNEASWLPPPDEARDAVTALAEAHGGAHLIPSATPTPGGPS